jgi:hypothetical protein
LRRSSYDVYEANVGLVCERHSDRHSICFLLLRVLWLFGAGVVAKPGTRAAGGIVVIFAVTVAIAIAIAVAVR